MTLYSSSVMCDSICMGTQAFPRADGIENVSMLTFRLRLKHLFIQKVKCSYYFAGPTRQPVNIFVCKQNVFLLSNH